jgi:flagellar biosynthetic protein FliR
LSASFYIRWRCSHAEPESHHLLLDGIYYSYQYIPVDKMALSFGSEGFAEFIAKSFNTMFITAFQLSAPVVACLFLVDLALGIVARTVPQLNVFVVGLPLKIAITFIMLIICMAVMFKHDCSTSSNLPFGQ